MQTEIEYLKEFRDDLLEAAWREGLGGSPKKPRRRPSGWPRRWLVALGVAASLALAGGVGYVALRLTAGTHEMLRPYAAILSTPSGAPAPGGPGGSNFFGFTPSDESVAQHGPGPGPSGVNVNTPGVTSPVGPELSRIIKTASLEVVVGGGTFKDAFQRAVSIATRYDGFVQSSSTSGSRAGTMLIRVPAARFERALADLRGLGSVSFQSVKGQDVTSQFIDLGARLRIARARRNTLLTLLGEATTIGQTLQVQNVLDQTQLNIEQLQGQLRYLSRRTSFATIDMSMREKGVTVVKPEKAAPIHNPSFTRGIKHAIAGFLGVIVATVVGLGYLIPVAVFGMIVWLIVRRVRRARTA